MITILIICGLVLLAGLLIYNAIATQKWQKDHLTEQYKAEAEHYYWNFIYYNPDDPRLFKPRGGGYTINFGRPVAIMGSLVVVGAYIMAIIYMYS